MTETFVSTRKNVIQGVTSNDGREEYVCDIDKMSRTALSLLP